MKCRSEDFRIWLFALAGVLALAWSLRASDQRFFAFQSKGVLASGRSYSIIVKEHLYLRRNNEAPDDGSRWGIDGGHPKSYGAVLELSVDAERVYLPRKLFDDLSHLSSVNVGEAGGLITITLRGGDGAGSFEAVITVDQHEFVRVVRHAEVPDSIWERLTIHNHESANGQ